MDSDLGRLLMNELKVLRALVDKHELRFQNQDISNKQLLQELGQPTTEETSEEVV